MLEEFNARLEKIIDQKRLKNKLEQDLHTVELASQEQTVRFASLSAQLEREKVDVEKLERTSLTNLFASILGSREQQLEKERQELLTAQLAYQQTKHQVAYLERERERLLEQIESLGDVEAKYESILSEKERLLRQTNQAVAGELLEYSQQIADLNIEIKEISEAISSGNSVIASLEQLIEALEGAKNWGTWDMLGGEFLATALKHAKIDDARNCINDVQTKMSQLTRELADIRNNVELKIVIEEFETFADFFIDNLIVDWVVQSKIVGSLEQSKKAKESISQTIVTLENLLKVAQAKRNSLKQKRAHIIENN
jgi:DNA repair exonuclease SbcCD ATPase subunit